MSLNYNLIISLFFTIVTENNHLNVIALQICRQSVHRNDNCNFIKNKKKNKQTVIYERDI